MTGKFALIIGNSHYDDPSLGRLKAPDVDVEALADVLESPEVGQFDEVASLLNESCAVVRKAIARFFDHRQRDDLLVLYFSGHGVKDEQGHLYLALRDTESGLLAGTAIESGFISGRMDRSFSKRQVLVLDCCHSGAFARGAKAAQGVSVGTAQAFEGHGIGRVILTATDATQYAWEGDQVIGDAQSSLFTHFLIDGLKTGAADRDNDGVITVDELYDYAHEHVINSTPRQTPHKWIYRQPGDIILAQNPFAKSITLPPEIEEARDSTLSSLRLEAVRNLETLLRGHHEGRARAARAALQALSLDDSRKVANAAIEVLRADDENAPPTPPLAEDAEKRKIDDVETPFSDAEPTDGVDDRIAALTSDIFISYAREDRAKASALANALVARGWKVWWDRKIAPGEAFDVVIERELSTCKCAVVLWSTNSVNATWVRNEARRASKRRVLVPILIEQVETPLEFENLQAADLTSWDAAANHPELETVFDRIQALSPIPSDRLARTAVKTARREFGAGQQQAALARLERFRPAHDLVTRALAELRGQVERAERERARVARDEAQRVEQERARLAREKAERAEQERARVAREEAERVEQERARIARAEEERLEQERARRARIEAARLEHERIEAKLLERARAESVGQFDAEQRPFEIEEQTIRRAVMPRPVAVLDVPDVSIGVPAATPSRVKSRLVQVSVAMVILALIGAASIVRLRPARTATVDSRQHQSTDAERRQTTPEPTRTPAAVPATRAATPDNPAQDPPPPADVQPPRSPVPESPHARIEPRDTPAAKPATPANRLDEELRKAQEKMAQAKQAALDSDASQGAKEAFDRGLQRERQAVTLRRGGRIDAAIRSYAAAAEQFAAALKLAEEDAKQARLAAERNKKDTAPAPAPPPDPRAAAQPDRKPLNTDVEQEVVTETLHRYEAAYASLKPENVRNVFPSARIDQLAKDFAGYRSYFMNIKIGELKFYTFADGRSNVSVTARVSHDVQPKSGPRNQSEQSQTFTLEKQGQGWIIVAVR